MLSMIAIILIVDKSAKTGNKHFMYYINDQTPRRCQTFVSRIKGR